MKKFICFMFLMLLSLSLFACGGSKNPGNGGGGNYEDVDPSVTGTLDLMVWSGDGEYRENLGKQNLTKDDLTTINVASFYAVAKEFNKKFPNVKINLYAKLDDPNSGDMSWEQEIENFKNTHGKYPDLYASTNLVNDLEKGMVADLSIFSDDPVYKSINPSLMEMCNYYGFQAGLPSYALPWGVYVNKELANKNNIYVPGPDWNWDEYTAFVTSAPGETSTGEGFFGALNPGMTFLRTSYIEPQLSSVNVGNSVFVNLTQKTFTSCLANLTKQAASSLYTQMGMGNVSQEFQTAGSNYSYYFFCRNMLLTSEGDPWMLQFSTLEGNDGYVQSNDWDIYPCPDMDGKGAYDNVVIDPMALYNQCGTNGKCTDAQYAQLQLAYKFLTFYLVDTASWKARAEQQYKLGSTYSNALNDSFPIVTGDAFDAQMEYWFSSVSHAAYADEERFPGFTEVIRLWKAGKIRGITDKAYPLKYTDEDGNTVDCMEPITKYYDEAYVGVGLADESWAATYRANLSDYQNVMNDRFAKAFLAVQDALVTYYGWDRSKF